MSLLSPDGLTLALNSTLQSLVANTDSNVVPVATAAFLGYLATILINSRPRNRKKLEDFPNCGQRLADPAIWGYTQDDECLWDCQWVDAPFIDPNIARQSACTGGGLGGINCGNTGTGGLDGQASLIKNDDLGIYFVFNLLKLPKDLTCLNDCGFMFHKFWDDSCFNKTTGTMIPLVTTDQNGKELEVPVHGDHQDFYNCYMDKRRLSKTEFQFVNFGDREDYHVTRDFRDVVFEICYLAEKFKKNIEAGHNGYFGKFYKLCHEIEDIYYTPNPIVPSENRQTDSNSILPSGKENKIKRGKKAKDKRKTKSDKKNKNRKPKDMNEHPKNNKIGRFLGFMNQTNRADIFGDGDRLGGPLGFMNLFSQRFSTGYPWQCSLRTSGYRGRHKCGVTLLSGPPKDTILVGAAHCNYVCRNEMNEILEMCCCRDNELGGCKNKSSYCLGTPKLQKSRVEDMQIVCGEHNIGPVPEHISWENEIILGIKKIVNHEDFKPGKPLGGNDIAVYHVDENEARQKMKMYSPLDASLAPDLFLFLLPYLKSEGNIDWDGQSSFLVNLTNSQVGDKKFYDEVSKKYKRIMLESFGKMMLPACLPKQKYLPNRFYNSIFSSWKDPKPGYLHPTADFDKFDLLNYLNTGGGIIGGDSNGVNPSGGNDITDYFNRHGAASTAFHVWPSHAKLDQEECKDPDWMNSDTFYPAGTTCYRDPSSQSCMLFGASGSGLVRQFGTKETTATEVQITDELTLDQIKDEGTPFMEPDEIFQETEQYAFVGPLSMYKGCDRASNINYEHVRVVKDDANANENLRNDDEDDATLTDIDFNNDKNTATLEPQKWLMMYGGDNVAVFTDAYCYLDWIANQFNMDPPEGWKKPDHCSRSTGDITDVNKEECKTAQGSTCDFSGNKTLHVKIGAYEKDIPMDKCFLLDVAGGYADNINMCVNQKGKLDHCANNCKGVDANSVVAGGVAALAVGHTVAASLLGGATVGGVATVGVGGGFAAMMLNHRRNRPHEQTTRRRCPRSRPCRDRSTGRCCRGFTVRGRKRCPRRCI